MKREMLLINQTVQRRFQIHLRLAHHAASRAWENSRPMAAPICATSLAGPSRSSRAMDSVFAAMSPSQGGGVACEFGGHNAARKRSPEHSPGEQG